MKILDYEKARIVRMNEKEYGSHYNRIRFIREDQIPAFTKRREELLQDILRTAESGFKQSKLDVRRMSPGCRICAEGGWSCLFINGICNCKCFYCPAVQNQVDVPTSSSLQFEEAKDYIRYIQKYNFKGVSLSGGEPLLTFDKTLAFLKAVRRAFGREKYIWLYTNGALVDEEKIGLLKSEGLDEIRFDLSARNYKTDKIRLAVGQIPHVTVEIPAIPEDLDILKRMMHELERLGVNYLNLHQLRLTPHNFEHLVKRDYTFLHGNKVTVLESELAALEILKYSLEENINLPVNYCSFVFKNRFQNAAARRRIAPGIIESFEEMTESGFIRRIAVHGSAEEIQNLQESLKRTGAEQSLFKLEPGNRMLLHPGLIREGKIKAFRLVVSYFHVKLLPKVSYRNPFREFELSSSRKIVVERIRTADDLALSADDFELFRDIFLTNEKDFTPYENIAKWNQLARFEWIEEGLQEYFYTESY